MIKGSEISLAAWQALLESSRTGSWFQSPEAFSFFSDLPSIFEPFAYGLEECGMLKGVLVGFITKEANPVKQCLTARAIISGGPLLADDISDEALKALLTGVRQDLQRKSIYIETRNFNDYSRWKPVFEVCGWQYEPHLNFQVDTASLSDPFQIIGKHRRRYIRMTMKDGSEVVECPTLAQVKEYYSILSDLYRSKVKTPLFPWPFFEKLYKLDNSKFLLVTGNDRVIGGAVCVCLIGRGVYEWFACGLDGVQRGSYPSSVATFAGIKYAADHDFPLFDFMGAGKPGEPYGVRDFKAEFGGKLVEYGRFKCINKPLLYKLGCLGVKILKKL